MIISLLDEKISDEIYVGKGRKMKPLLSVQSRYRTWISKHYELSINGHKLSTYHNKYKNRRCFIIANGPSLLASDLDILSQQHEITFGMNRIYKIFDSTEWRPTFYVCEDELIAKGQQAEINAIQAEEKFIPVELKWYHGVGIDGARYFHINYRDEEQFQFGFSTDISHQIECRGTVTFTCMQLAAYMGFSEVYLLGVDHNYQRIIDINGNVMVDSNVKDYFCEGYDTDIHDAVVHDMGNNTRAYLDAKKYCEDTGKMAIYNATRGGKLEIFERVDFEDLF